MSVGTLLLAIALGVAPGQSDEKSPLPRGLVKTHQILVHAYHGGNVAGVLETLVPMLPRLTEAQIEGLDAALGDEGIPPVRRLLVEARLALVQQNLASSLPEPEIRERLLLLRAVAEHIDEWLRETREHPLVTGSEPPARSMTEFERQLWEIHVLRNKLLSALRTSAYGTTLAQGVTERQKERLTPPEIEILKKFAGPAAGIQEADGVLARLEIDTRLARLNYGLEVLENDALTKERFMAAWSTLHDAEELRQALKQAADEAAPLSHAALLESLERRAARARELAGDLAPQAKRFFEGLHWWLRGRYGIGPELAGLAKSAAALDVPGGLVWLYMPSQPPVAADVDDGQREIRPTYERRHHHIWAWEDRRISPTFETGGNEDASPGSPGFRRGEKSVDRSQVQTFEVFL
ncbi:MAG: hypothetical protein KY476_12165 [Planctomycetes bacterium]|nr:hypothetical protein [Planctomycetota bacterium]